VGDGIVSHYAFRSGVIGEFESFVSEDRAPTSYFTLLLEGTAGTIGIRSFGDRQLYRYDRAIPLPGLDEGWQPLRLDGHAPEGPEDSKERYIWAHQRLIRDLLAAGKEEREPMASARAAATVLEMIAAAYESHFAGHRIAFPLARRDHPLESIAAAGQRKGVPVSV
jgi:predicted dehydrogenase